MTKVQSHVMLVLHNVRMVPSNVRKNKGTTKCDKSIIICDVSTTQCEIGTIKCDVFITCYCRLLTGRYCTPPKKGEYSRITLFLVFKEHILIQVATLPKCTIDLLIKYNKFNTKPCSTPYLNYWLLW